MKQNFSTAPSAYDRRDQQELRRQIEEEDRRNLKRDQHLELIPEAYVILRSPNGTRYYLTVSNAGVLGTTAV